MNFELKESLLFDGLSKSADNVYIFKSLREEDLSVWSENAVSYFGFPEGYETNLTPFWISRIHPDDRDGYIKDLDEVFSGEKISHYYEYRVKNAEGNYVWVECCGYIEKDEEEHKTYFVGMVTRLDLEGKFDPITNCLNFKEFYFQQEKEQQSLILVGLDGFRKIVNRLGFSESNKILEKLGNLLQRNCGKRNVFRMTGDEFLVTLPMYNKEEIEFLFHKIAGEFQTEIRKDYDMSLTFSGGTTYFDPMKEEKEDAIKRLEHCLEYAKQNGNGLLTFYSIAIEAQHERSAKLQEYMTRAIANDFEGFKLVYQPIVRAGSHQLDGVEALLRFYCEEFGMVSPAEFIPILEATGEIKEVGRWVGITAIKQKIQWAAQMPHLRMGFNVSLRQLSDTSTANEIVRMIQDAKIQPDEIIIELTESCRMENAEQLRRNLSPLTSAGIWVFLDDFGMELSTFTMVQELPINGIKVDHSFVREMAKSQSERKDLANVAIVSSICRLGEMLGLRVIAEGVETEKIDALLCDMGIAFMQGYYYSRPIPAEVFAEQWFKEKENS